MLTPSTYMFTVSSSRRDGGRHADLVFPRQPDRPTALAPDDRRAPLADDRGGAQLALDLPRTDHDLRRPRHSSSGVDPADRRSARDRPRAGPLGLAAGDDRRLGPLPGV